METTPVASLNNSSSTSLRLEFRGQTGEYFRIWIVNLALTILTLGIYSAWAKVRTRRYLLGHTVLEGSAFDFHADPVKILYGRLIMGVLFAAYFFGARISILIPLVAAGLFLALLPWIIVKGMAFNLGNTSYRNLRFGFAKDFGGAYRTYGFSYLITLLTLGLAFPYALYRHHRFRVSRSRYGQMPFRFDGEPGPFWKIYGVAALLWFGTAIASVIVAVMLTAANKFFAVLAVPLVYLGIFVATAYVRAHTYNLVAGHSHLSGIGFRGRLQAFPLFILYLTNLLACVFTLGLLIPWAVIRVARYKIENTEVVTEGVSLDDFVAGEGQRGSPVADAAVDFWDIDLGF